MSKYSKTLPSAPKAWLKEIAAAYLDAEEAIPFGPLAGVAITKKDLFHLAPRVCLKFRRMEQSKKNLSRSCGTIIRSLISRKVELNADVLR